MSEIKYIFAAAAVSALMLIAGCSAKSNTSTTEPIPTEAVTEVTETAEMTTEPLVSLSKETTQTTSTATTVDVETTQTTVTATGYVAATDYRTFEGTGLDGEAGSAHNAKPVSNEDLYISVAEVGVMPGYTLDWTGMSPWSSIYITDAYGNSYVYDRDNGNGTAVNSATGQEYKFDVITSGGLIDGFCFYNFPQSDYYTITVNGSAQVTGSDYPLTWSGVTIYA
ncbi:MAG: hypothetical protein WBK46_15430 [Ruminococcus flavefaciens]